MSKIWSIIDSSLEPCSCLTITRQEYQGLWHINFKESSLQNYLTWFKLENTEESKTQRLDEQCSAHEMCIPRVSHAE